eukprot:312425_1
MGCEYKLVLDALNIIQNIINCGNEGAFQHLKFVSKNVEAMVMIIISNQLLSVDHATTYLNNLIDTYFNSKTIIELNYELFRQQRNLSLINSFFYSFESYDYGWIKIKDIILLFPNTETIEIRSINICSSVLDDLLSYLQKEPESYKLDILIYVRKYSKSLMEKFATSYKEKFNEINFEYSYQADTLRIRIRSKTKVDKLTMHYETLYIGNTQKAITPISDQRSEWTVFITTSPNELVKPETIQCVTYYLHPTCSPSAITLAKSPFLLKGQGWGYFHVRVNIKFHQQCNRKDLFCSHLLNFDKPLTIYRITEITIEEYYNENKRLLDGL